MGNQQAESLMQYLQTADHAELVPLLPQAHPASLYIYAARLFSEGDGEGAVFWFYVGQLRYRFLLAVATHDTEHNDLAAMSALNEEVGQPINLWAGEDPIAWAAAIDKALEWDAANDNLITPKEPNQAALQRIRGGLTGLRDDILHQADEIRAERKVQGLPVKE